MSKKRPRLIGVIDCETDPFLFNRAPRPFLWGFYDGKVYRDYTDIEELIAVLRRFKGIVYAHNGGKFDFHFLFPYLTPHTEILIIHGRVAKCFIGECELRDSYCILPIPLAEYNKTKIDYMKFEVDVRDQHMPEIQAYLKDDCVYLHELVSQFVAEYGTSITLASAAMTYWKKKLGNEVPESDKPYYDKMVSWYAGGRVQCFVSGTIKRRFHVVDINSAYPFAMLQKHPYGIAHRYVTKPSMKSTSIKGTSFYRIVAIPKGSLPFRDSTGELSFPEDDEPREYHCTGWELRAALDTKSVKVLKSIERIDFTECRDFANYIHHFYQLKKDSTKGTAAYIFAKLFMNSLYGKFAADPSAYRNYALLPPQELGEWTDEDGDNASDGIGRLTGPWAFAGDLGPWSLVTNSRLGFDEDGADVQCRSNYYNVATGASITGFVRAYLWRHIAKVRAGGGAMLYCDTDSIVCTWPEKAGPLPFGQSKELGDWTHEGRFTFGAIAGKKLYAFLGEDGEWKTACKGVDLPAEDIVAIAQGEERVYQREAPSMRVGASGAAVSFITRKVRKTAKVVTKAPKRARK